MLSVEPVQYSTSTRDAPLADTARGHSVAVATVGMPQGFFPFATHAKARRSPRRGEGKLLLGEATKGTINPTQGVWGLFRARPLASEGRGCAGSARKIRKIWGWTRITTARGRLLYGGRRTHTNTCPPSPSGMNRVHSNVNPNSWNQVRYVASSA